MIEFDFDDLINDELPPKRRQYVTIAWLQFLFRPLRNMLASFYLFFATIKYELAFNSTVIYLERIINDMFDPANREIYITDGVGLAPTFIFNRTEGNEPTYIYNRPESVEFYMYNRQEIGMNQDFIINIPLSLSINEHRLRALVNKYKTAGKNYSIVYY